MWKIYKYNGRYIKGDFLSQHTSESAALKKAIKFAFSEKTKKNKEILIWLDDKEHTPVGVIVKKTRG